MLNLFFLIVAIYIAWKLLGYAMYGFGMLLTKLGIIGPELPVITARSSAPQSQPK